MWEDHTTGVRLAEKITLFRPSGVRLGASAFSVRSTTAENALNVIALNGRFWPEGDGQVVN
jgi:hypothetical protein